MHSPTSFDRTFFIQYCYFSCVISQPAAVFESKRTFFSGRKLMSRTLSFIGILITHNNIQFLNSLKFSIDHSILETLYLFSYRKWIIVRQDRTLKLMNYIIWLTSRMLLRNRMISQISTFLRQFNLNNYNLYNNCF